MATLSHDAQEMRRLLMSATNVDECRLIVDMFLAKSGLHLEPVKGLVDHSKPPPQPSDASQLVPLGIDTSLERSLVELFLGGVGEEESGDEQMTFSADDAANKESSVSLPLSPPYTPDSIYGNGLKTGEPVTVKDTQVPTPASIAVT